MSAGPGLPVSPPDRYSDQPIKVSPRMTVDSTCAPPVIGARAFAQCRTFAEALAAMFGVASRSAITHCI